MDENEKAVVVIDLGDETLPVRGPIVQDNRPEWPHESGGPWAMGLTADGKTCWV